MIDLNTLNGKELYKNYYLYKENKIDIVDELPKITKNILFYRYINLTKNQSININFNYNIDKQKFYFIVYNSIDKETNTHTLIFGIEIYNIMEYQNNKEFKRFLIPNEKKESKEIENVKKNYNNLINLVKEFNLYNNIYIFSSFILTILGTTITKDIDCFVFNINEKNINKILNKSNDEIDLIIYNSKTKNYDKKKDKHQYGKIIYTYKFANEFYNEPDIFHVINDFNYIFIFDGIKYFGLNFYIRRALSRSHYKSYTDLIGLKEKNNYPLENFKEFACIPNFKNRQEKLIYVFNDKYINTTLYPCIKKYLKLWYSLDYDLNEIKKIFPVCRDIKSIYNRSNMIKMSESVRNIVSFNNIFKINILNKYTFKNNKKFNVLDIGAGKFNDYFKFWKKTNGTYIGLEPSIDSLNIAKSRIKDDTIDNVKFVHGYGDESWDTYNDILDYKYDIIVFSFTIHYMIKNFDILLNNLKKVIKKDTIIIIFYLNGDKVIDDLNKIYYNTKTVIPEKAIIIKDPIYKDILYYINWFENINESIIVYFKDVYGLDQGSIEELVFDNFLNKNLNKINMFSVENKNFNDNKEIKNMFDHVISYQKYNVFKF